MDANVLEYSAAEAALMERLRPTLKGLPHYAEKRDGHNHLSLRVKDKPFAFVGNDAKAPTLWLKTDKQTQAERIAAGQVVKARYIGQHGWYVAQVDGDIAFDLLEEWLVESYWVCAPKSLVKAYAKQNLELA